MRAIELYELAFSEALDLPLPSVRRMLDELVEAGVAPALGEEIEFRRAVSILEALRDDRSGVRCWLTMVAGTPIGQRLDELTPDWLPPLPPRE